jgi:hypothetical protein
MCPRLQDSILLLAHAVPEHSVLRHTDQRVTVTMFQKESI